MLLVALARPALGQADPEGIVELPPIPVRPQPEASPETIDQPPITVTPDADSLPPEPTAPAPAYPSLREQGFQGLDSIVRGDGSLFDTPSLATIIDRQQLDERMPQDMFQALEHEVGILVQRTARGQASPFVRGLTGQQVLILVDGIRMNNATFRSGPNQYFNFVDPGQVERVEVLRGPHSVLYGSDAIGGAINIVTRSADRSGDPYAGGSFTEYFSTADTGSYSRLNVERFNGHTGLFTGASYLNLNDLRTGGELGRQPFTGYDQYAGDVRIDRLLDCSTMLTIGLAHFEQQDVPRSDRFPPFAPPANVRPTFLDPQQRNLAYVRLQGVAPGLGVDAYLFTASYQRIKDGFLEQRSATRHDIGEADTDTVGLSLLGTTDLDYWGRLTYGFDWYHDDVDAFTFSVNPQSGAITPRTPRFPDDGWYERLGTYLYWDVPLTCRLSADAGVRWENIDAAGTPIVSVNGVPTPVPIAPSFSDWIASVGLVYRLTDSLNLVGSVGEGFRAPNLDDLVATNPLVQQTGTDLPSPDLRPERSVNYEVGLKLDRPCVRSQVFVFWTDLDDMIQRRPGPNAGLFERTNRDSYLNGVEWYGEYLLGRGWSTYGNFAYTFGKNVEDQTPLSRIPPTQGVAGLRWRDAERRRWFDVYGWMVRRQDRLNFQDVSDIRIPPGGTPGFGIVNLRAGTTLGAWHQHQLSLTLENLFDRGYRVHGSGVDGPGFNAILGYVHTR